MIRDFLVGALLIALACLVALALGNAFLRLLRLGDGDWVGDGIGGMMLLGILAAFIGLFVQCAAPLGRWALALFQR
jgi:hypothetical protein